MQLFKKTDKNRDSRPSTARSKHTQMSEKQNRLAMFPSMQTVQSSRRPDTPGRMSFNSNGTQVPDSDIRFGLKDLLEHISAHTKYPSTFLPICMQAEPQEDIEP